MHKKELPQNANKALHTTLQSYDHHEYYDKGILLNDIYLIWHVDRKTVRQLLNQNHKAIDSIIDFSQYKNGSELAFHSYRLH
jgi:hypothetical protein